MHGSAALQGPVRPPACLPSPVSSRAGSSAPGWVFAQCQVALPFKRSALEVASCSQELLRLPLLLQLQAERFLSVGVPPCPWAQGCPGTAEHGTARRGGVPGEGGRALLAQRGVTSRQAASFRAGLRSAPLRLTADVGGKEHRDGSQEDPAPGRAPPGTAQPPAAGGEWRRLRRGTAGGGVGAKGTAWSSGIPVGSLHSQGLSRGESPVHGGDVQKEGEPRTPLSVSLASFLGFHSSIPACLDAQMPPGAAAPPALPQTGRPVPSAGRSAPSRRRRSDFSTRRCRPDCFAICKSRKAHRAPR